MPSENKELFYRIGTGSFIPPEIRFYAGGLTPKGDSLDARRGGLSHEIAEFVARAPHFLQNRLFYLPYCEEAGLMVKRVQNSPIGELTVEVPSTPFKEVTLDASLVGDIRWQNFMDRYQIPREILVHNVIEVLGMIPRIDARYLDPWDITAFDQSMETGAYRVALTLIPDLIDEEARALFNNQTTVKLIKERLGPSDIPPY